MDESIIVLMILSLCLGAGCWLVFIWTVKKGQLDDVEKPKHRMMDDDEHEQPKKKFRSTNHTKNTKV